VLILAKTLFREEESQGEGLWRPEDGARRTQPPVDCLWSLELLFPMIPL
jgi:hypothetical protein